MNRNLFHLTEEEKNRIINLHENATKKQYLSEVKSVTKNQGATYEYQWEGEDPISQEIISNIRGGLLSNEDESKIQASIFKIKDLKQLKKVNDDIKAANKSLKWQKSYDGLDKIIAVIFQGAEGAAVKDHLKKLGAPYELVGYDTFSFTNTQDLTGKKTPTLDQRISTGVQANVDATSKRQQNINSTYCSVKNGVITLKGQSQNEKWETYVGTYKITNAEIEIAKKSCPTVKKDKPKVSVNPKTTNELSQGTAVLQLNSTGDAVTEVQNMLVKLGKLTQGSFTSGTYDEATKNAVIAFQQEKKGQLSADGKVGTRTFPLLKADADKVQSTGEQGTEGDEDEDLEGEDPTNI